MKKKDKRLCLDIGERLRMLREEWQLKKHQMAHRLGISPNNYIKYESGQIFPNPTSQHQLLTKYHISMDWFIFGIGPRYSIHKKVEEELLKQIADLKKESEDRLEENTELKKELEASEEQKDDLENELKREKAAMAALPEMSEDVKELVKQMNRIPLLRYEILAQFQRFLREEKGPAGFVEE